MCISHFLYPFICWYILLFSASWLWCCSLFRGTSILDIFISVLLYKYSVWQVGLLGYVMVLRLIFWGTSITSHWNCTILHSEQCANLPIPTHPYSLYFIKNIVTILRGMSWYFNCGFLNCISVMIDNIECFFFHIHVSHSFVFFEEIPIQVFGPFSRSDY